MTTHQFQSNGLSVILCCKNSVKTIANALKCIQNQDTPNDLSWEVVIINNASSDNTETAALIQWNKNRRVNLKIIIEPCIGTINARLRGAAEAKFEYLLFVDDDNYLEANYIKNAILIMNQNPEIGACGGNLIFAMHKDKSLPLWFKNFQASYAVGSQEKNITEKLKHPYLVTAGMITRKSLWLTIIKSGYPKLLLGGGVTFKTMRGEDVEMSYAIQMAGYKLYYSNKLKLQHDIKEERLTKKYLRDLFIAGGKENFYFSSYENVYHNKKNSWIKSLSFSFLWLIIYIGKYFLKPTLLGKFKLISSFHKFKSIAFHKSLFINNYHIVKKFHTQLQKNISTTKPLISIIITARNTENYIDDCLQSVQKQTFQNFEVYIVDDASEDTTKKIINHYQQKDTRIHLITNQKRIGQSASRNKALAKAKGQYIAILDSDDINLPCRLQNQYLFLENNPEIFLIGGGIIRINNKKKPLSIYNKRQNHKNLIKLLLTKKAGLLNSTIMFRNDKTVYYRSKFDDAEDYDLYLRLINQKKKIACLNKIISYYRIIDTSASFSQARRLKQFFLAQKARSFYYQRIKHLKDDYEKFDPRNLLTEYTQNDNFKKINLEIEIDRNFNLRNRSTVKKLSIKYFSSYGFFNKYIIYFLLNMLPNKALYYISYVKNLF